MNCKVAGLIILTYHLPVAYQNMILVQRNRLKANMTNRFYNFSKWVKSGFPIILFKNTHKFSPSQRDRIAPRRAPKTIP